MRKNGINFRNFYFAAALLGSSCGFKNDTTEIKQMTVDYDESATLDQGVGVNAITHEGLGECIKGTWVASPSQNIISWNITYVEDKSELEKYLSISSSASIKALVGEVSARTNFLNRTNFSSYSVYALLNIRFTGSKQLLKGPEFSTEAYKALYTNNPIQFREACGDEFIAAVEKGGEFSVLMEIKTQSTSEKKEAQLNISGKYKFVSGELDVKTGLDELNSKYSITASGYEITGSKVEPFSGNVSELFKNASNFVNKMNDGQAAPMRYTTKSYVTLGIMQPNPLDISSQKLFIENASQHKRNLETLLNDVRFIKANANQFENIDENSLHNAEKEITKSVNALRETISICFNDFKGCKWNEDLVVPVVNLPKRRDVAFSQKEGGFPECGVDLYTAGTGPACGTPVYPVSSRPECGVELYNLCKNSGGGLLGFESRRSEYCGVELFREGSDPVCGTHAVETTIARNSRCRIIPGHMGRNSDFGTSTSGWAEDADRCPDGTVEFSNNKENCWDTSYIASRSCGIIANNTCRHENFGVELYKECASQQHAPIFGESRSAACGVERYSTCLDTSKDPAYPVCRNQAFGVEKYKVCKLQCDDKGQNCKPQN